MYLQAVLHVEAGLAQVRELWGRDPWFSAELLRECGRNFFPDRAVDATPGGGNALSGTWLDFGPSGRMGLLPVSDGTDIVLQLSATLSQKLRERLFHSTQRGLRRFAAMAKFRLEGRAASEPT